MDLDKPSSFNEALCLCAVGMVLSLLCWLPAHAATTATTTTLRLPALCELSLEELLRIRVIVIDTPHSETP